MPARDHEPFIARGIVLAATALLAVILVGGGLVVRNRLFFDHTPAFRASEQLLQAVRTRPLTAVEFDDALALWECGERVVETRLGAIIPLAIAKSPDQRPMVVEHFTRLADDPSNSVRQRRAKFLLSKLSATPLPSQP